VVFQCLGRAARREEKIKKILDLSMPTERSSTLT
jgi:hypothetical protein